MREDHDEGRLQLTSVPSWFETPTCRRVAASSRFGSELRAP